jgi:transcriptional regulator with XRE-family HTH domain
MAETYGEVLARLRAAKGWTMYRLAMESGLKQQSLWNLESGKMQPKLATAVKIARALGVSVEAFVTEDQPAEDRKPAKKKEQVR